MSIKFTEKERLQFDLEQQIMQAWHTKEDLEVFLSEYMDGSTPMTEDHVHNIVYGIACIHDLRCQKALKTFEDFLKELRKERERVDTVAFDKAIEEAARVVETYGLDPISVLPTESFRDGMARQIRKLKFEGEDS